MTSLNGQCHRLTAYVNGISQRHRLTNIRTMDNVVGTVSRNNGIHNYIRVAYRRYRAGKLKKSSFENSGQIFAQLQYRLGVWFSKFNTYSIRVACDQGQHSMKIGLDYFITVLRVFLMGAMKLQGLQSSSGSFAHIQLLISVQFVKYILYQMDINWPYHTFTTSTSSHTTSKHKKK